MFAPADAKRYAEALTDGRLALIENAYSFTPEDQPERLAEEIARFVPMINPVGANDSTATGADRQT